MANTTYQYEPLPTPSGWNAEEKRFIARLTDILDDIYLKWGRIGEKELSSSVSGKISSLTSDGGMKVDSKLSLDMVDALAAHISQIVADEIETDKLYVALADIIKAEVGVAVIEDASITTAKIRDLAVIAAKIADAAVTNAKIEDLAVDTAKIADATITSAKIKDAAIDTAKIALGAITTALIATGAVGTAQIADGSITDAKIVELTADKINAGTLSVERLLLKGENGLFYAINAQAGGLTASQLTEEQYQNAISGTALVARSVTADKIAAKSITANEIAAGTITAAEINVAQFFAAEGVVNSLQTADISGNESLRLYVQEQTAATADELGTDMQHNYNDLKGQIDAQAGAIAGAEDQNAANAEALAAVTERISGIEIEQGKINAGFVTRFESVEDVNGTLEDRVTTIERGVSVEESDESGVIVTLYASDQGTKLQATTSGLAILPAGGGEAQARFDVTGASVPRLLVSDRILLGPREAQVVLADGTTAIMDAN